jgi:hypothetical protein
MFSSKMTTQSSMEDRVHLKKIRRFPHAFRTPLDPILNLSKCTSSFGAKESISVAIPLDHRSKKGAMKQNAGVSHG